MASCRKNHQEDARLRFLQIISNNSQTTSRDLASELRISNGSAYYLLTPLIN